MSLFLLPCSITFELNGEATKTRRGKGKGSLKSWRHPRMLSNPCSHCSHFATGLPKGFCTVIDRNFTWISFVSVHKEIERLQSKTIHSVSNNCQRDSSTTQFLRDRAVLCASKRRSEQSTCEFEQCVPKSSCPVHDINCGWKKAFAQGV